ncbi:MAG: 3-deoxy-D-manno-octulosonic acid transferase [Muribaculaceae bacterium]
MNPLYNLSISLYRAGARIAALRSDKVRKMLRGQNDTWRILRECVTPGASYVWVHAASLGEFEQGRPLIERIKREQPDKRVLLTFFSPSGYEVRKDYKGADIVAYLPFDTARNACRLLDTINVEAALFIKYEFWGNYIHELHRRGIPTYLVSGIFRPGQTFFKPWGGMFRGILECYTRLFVQDEPSRQLLNGIGIENVTVAGDTRFDRVTDIMATAHDIPALDAFTADTPTVIVAGSTWPPDEAILIPYLNAHPAIKAIIAPHEVKEGRMREIEAAATGRCVRLSQANPENVSQAQVLIIDGYGLLSSAYRYGRIAYVGGGFGVGIHNINEAAVYGMPVIFGPRYSKFKEAVDLIALSGAFSVSDSGELNKVLDRLTTDSDALAVSSRIAGGYIRDNLGATDTVYEAIAGRL